MDNGDEREPGKVEGGRYKIEGSVQPTKTTCFAREESKNVGRDTQPAVAVLVSAGLRLETWSLSYLIYPPVNSCSSIMIGWLRFFYLWPPRLNRRFFDRRFVHL